MKSVIRIAALLILAGIPSTRVVALPDCNYSALESLGTVVPFPWPDVVTVRAID